MDSPVTFQVKYPETSSRGILLLRSFFGAIYVGIPHMFMLYFFAVGAMFVMFCAWWCILFTGKYPEKMFHFVLRFYRWILRVYLYMGLMTDVYPPFTGIKEVPGYDVLNFDVAYPEKLSQGMLLVKTFFGSLMIIPHIFCIYFVAIWAAILLFLSWWAILFTGKFPQSWFDFIVRLQRWGLRVVAYYPLMMSESYPPFHGREE